MMRTIPLAVMPSEITLSVSPAHEEIDTGAAPNPPRPWHRLGARSTAVVFLAAAAVAMAGWLYLLGEGLWAAVSWLLY
jgi:ferric-dicitrate binding protein FerR (iron transport regulator)